MVLNNLHYEPGVLAKESSILSLASGGRFELGIGAGDWPESFSAWGRPFPNAATRLKLLEETVDALRRVWTGTAVTTEGEHVRLDRASCTPAPERPPRVVVGVGGSPRTLREAVRFADEINVYTDEAVAAEARDAIAGAGRDVGISMFVGWEFDKWPDDPASELARWADLGVERFFVNVGAEDMSDRVRQLAAIDAS
jgi:alkanesulfonate monooxygenase SsuD/methylene tetrahydromethanopterin reductase-like flavin-dependent oxidoreductase (luciferase family)